MKVSAALQQDDLPAARLAVGRIVGRDTAALDAADVTRATVETVAENTNDGVVAPLLFLLVGGGAPLGVLYKAINTMDSMIGYRNRRYLYFGRVAAILDDIANFIPARIAGLLIVCAAHILKLDGRNAWHVFRRDRYNHSSPPNSGQTEAAFAGGRCIYSLAVTPNTSENLSPSLHWEMMTDRPGRMISAWPTICSTGRPSSVCCWAWPSRE